MKKEMTEKEKFQQEAYEKYRLGWMSSQGHYLPELKKALIEIMEEMAEEGDTVTCPEDVAPFVEAAVDSFLYERGFGGEIFVCRDEFLTEEFQDEEYVEALMGRPCPEEVDVDRTAYVSFSVSGSVTVPVEYKKGDMESVLLEKARYELDERALHRKLQDMEAEPLRILTDVLPEEEETAYVSFSVKGHVTVPVDYRDGDAMYDLVRKAEYELDELDLNEQLQDMEASLLCIRDVNGEHLF